MAKNTDRGSFYNPKYEETSGAPYQQNADAGANSVLPLNEECRAWSSQSGGASPQYSSNVSPEWIPDFAECRATPDRITGGGGKGSHPYPGKAGM